mmetsp:Transcript_24529/g.30164  ORF Transcript_24529/g.30164 Transcript_24529/m.30164 type:complete len:282 (-) Transcript_24529:366-1211(-)
MKLSFFLSLSLPFCCVEGFSTNPISFRVSVVQRPTTGKLVKTWDVSLQLTNDSETDLKEVDVTIKQKIQVCLYRFALTSASLAYATGQVSTLLLDSGSGLSTQTITSIDQYSYAIFGWGIILSAFLMPPCIGVSIHQKDENDMKSNGLYRLLNKVLPIFASFAIVTEIISITQQYVSQDSANLLGTTSENLLDNMVTLFICAICLREIGFFGTYYKAEAIIAILLTVISTLSNSVFFFSQPALTAGLALCLLVLSFGKFFEPIEDDLRPNNSAFFRDDRLS